MAPTAAFTTTTTTPTTAGHAAEKTPRDAPSKKKDTLTLFLAGDVMTARGIDQILQHPVPPVLYERYMTSATGCARGVSHSPWSDSNDRLCVRYVELAEARTGPVPRGVAPAYPWGDALAELEARQPEVRIINLETAVTRSEAAVDKGINYRMSPENFACIQAARPDCVVLANNHVLDWGVDGLVETLDTVQKTTEIRTAGAGRDAAEAAAPAVLDVVAEPPWSPDADAEAAPPRRDADAPTRVLVFAYGFASSGVPASWAATASRPGVAALADGAPERTADDVAQRVLAARRPGDVVIVSVHWGGNWGYDVPDEQRRFAHRLVDRGAADLVHGHSSHHPKGLEVYKDRLILYGCGDFLNDYEGISGHEAFRSDLVLMYLPRLRRADGALDGLDMVPFRTRHLRLERAAPKDAAWLQAMLDDQCHTLFGGRVALTADHALRLAWKRVKAE